MALIKNAELHYIRVIPNRPNRKFSRDNPTWEVQIRTYDSKQKREWEAQGIKMKAVVPDEEGARPYWKAVIKKKTIKKDGEPSSPIEVKYGDLSDGDPATIGNGSIADVRVFQYEYPKEDGGTGIANVLSGIKIKKLIKYTPKPRDDDFEAEDMEIVDDEEDEDVDEEEEAEEKPKTPALKPKSKFD